MAFHRLLLHRLSMAVLSFLLATPMAIAAESVSGGPVLVTRAVGEVGDIVVTSREVRINDAIDQAMADKPPASADFRVLTGQEKNFPAEVTQVLDEWVIYLEAQSLSTQSPNSSDINAAVKAVTDLWSNRAAWQALEPSASEIRAIVERKWIAREFERLKTNPQMAPVTDEDALLYYRKNRLRFGSLPFSSFKDSIKAFLVKQQTERRLSEWRELLRRKYKVRNFIAG